MSTLTKHSGYAVSKSSAKVEDFNTEMMVNPLTSTIAHALKLRFFSICYRLEEIACFELSLPIRFRPFSVMYHCFSAIGVEGDCLHYIESS